MDDVEARSIARQRFNTLLLTILGAAGLLMAAIGVYGVMSYSVQQRNQDSAYAWRWGRRHRIYATWSSVKA